MALIPPPPDQLYEICEPWLSYAKRGFRCFPIPKGEKRPNIKWAQYRSEFPSVATYSAWSRNESNIGTITGEPSGVIVLDIDSDDAKAEAQRLGLPTTVTAQTGKGEHHFYRWPGFTVSNRAGIFPGADIRGDGGYVVGVGSIHASGAKYEWIRSPDDYDFASAPDWLLDRLKRGQREEPPPSPPTPDAPEVGVAVEPAGQMHAADEAYCLAAIAAELEILRGTMEGGRNNQLNKTTFALAQLSAGYGFNWAPVEREIREAAFVIGLGQDEIAATMRSAYDKGSAQPRRAPNDKKAPHQEGAGGAPWRGEAAAATECTQAFLALDLSALASVEPKPKAFVVPGLIPAGEPTLFTGMGGAGKSLFAQQVATGMVAGVVTLRLTMPNEPALYISWEDDSDQLHWRQTQICEGLGIDMAGLAGRLHLVSRRGHTGNALCTFEKDVLRETVEYRSLAKTVRDTRAKLVFLDNSAHLFPGNENHRGQVTQFVGLLSSLAHETGAGIVLIGHTNKAFSQGNEQGNQFSGSTAWPNAVRSQITLMNDPETGLRRLRADKANYAEQGKETCFYWMNGYFVHEAEMSVEAGRAIASQRRLRADREAFLQFVRDRNGQNRPVSDKPSPTYAVTEFVKVDAGRAIGADRAKLAMESLFTDGLIEIGEICRGNDRKMKSGIREKDSHDEPP